MKKIEDEQKWQNFLNCPLTLSRPRVVTTTPTVVNKKILLGHFVLLIESQTQPIYVLYNNAAISVYNCSTQLHASVGERPS